MADIIHLEQVNLQQPAQLVIDPKDFEELKTALQKQQLEQEKLINEAYKKGIDDANKQNTNNYNKRTLALQSSLEKLLMSIETNFDTAKQSLMAKLNGKVKGLSLAILKPFLINNMLDQKTLFFQIDSVLKRLNSNCSLRLHLNPDDFQSLTNQLEAHLLANGKLEIIEDHNVLVNEFAIKMAQGELEFSINTQINDLSQAIKSYQLKAEPND